MPETPGYPYIGHAERDFFHSGVMAKRLSAVFTTLEELGKLDFVLKRVDWQAHGISRLATEDWWVEQQKVIARCKAAQAKHDKELERCDVLLQKPLAKLTTKDRELLRKHNLL